MATNSSNPALPPPPTPQAQPPPSTVARRAARRGFREVSSRYLTTPRNPSASPRPGQSPRRTPSRSGSEHGSDSETESVDENHRPTPMPQSRSNNGTFYFQAKPPKNRVVHKLFDEKPSEDCRRQSGSNTPAPSPVTRNPLRTPKVRSTVRVKRQPGGTPASPRSTRSEDDCGSDVETCSLDSCSSGTQSGSFCSSPPLTGTSTRNRGGTATDLRSSLSRVESSIRVSNPLVCRSLNSSLSNPPTFGAEIDKAVGIEARRAAVFGKPPQPPGIRGALDVRKFKKGKRAEEDAHSLKLLSNRLVQLIFMNAKAEDATQARMCCMEKELYGASVRISELRDRVNEKRVLLDSLRREMQLKAILESQMAYLDYWDSIESDQDESLSGVIAALQNAAIRVPVGNDVQVDPVGIKEALSSAMKVLEPSSSCLQKFVPSAEEVERLSLDLAKVVTKERGYIEECGNLLALAHNLQAKESSLRSTLIQMKRASVAAQ